MSRLTISASDFSREPCRSSNRFTIRSGCLHNATEGRQFCQRSGCFPKSSIVPTKPTTTEAPGVIDYCIWIYPTVYISNRPDLRSVGKSAIYGLDTRLLHTKHRKRGHERWQTRHCSQACVTH